MNFRTATIAFLLCMPLGALSQTDLSSPESAATADTETAQTRGRQAAPEEVVVTGTRSMLQLRSQMLAAEREVYDIFNQFNDEKRFTITCTTQTPTGSHLDSKNQHCQPRFEREAMRVQGQGYLESYRTFMDPSSGGDASSSVVHPASAVIASQQREYQRKMRQLAEENPEFLEAVIQYSEIREQYKSLTGISGE